MAVWDSFKDLCAEPLPKFDNPFLMAGWTKMPPLARIRQKVFVAAFGTFHPCKAVVQDAAVKKTINDLPYVGAKKAILFFKALIIDLLKLLEMVFNTLVVGGILWPAWAVYIGIGHELFLQKNETAIPSDL
jgi:hypothetical protein